MSIYTEYLKELYKHSNNIDCMKDLHNGFVRLQILENKIIEGEFTGYYTPSQRRELGSIAHGLHERYRDAIKVNDEVKAISREINKQRQKERTALKGVAI